MSTVTVYAKHQVYTYPASALPERCTHKETKRLRNADGQAYAIGCYACGKELLVFAPKAK